MSEDRAGGSRRIMPTLAELIDRLTIDQIKEVLFDGDRSTYAKEMADLEVDIDALFAEKGVTLSAHLLRVVVAIAQLNLHIWHCKDQMAENPERYDESLRLAHQLNGLRNRMKNRVLEIAGDAEPAARATNVGTDGLEGWDISV